MLCYVFGKNSNLCFLLLFGLRTTTGRCLNNSDVQKNSNDIASLLLDLFVSRRPSTCKQEEKKKDISSFVDSKLFCLNFNEEMNNSFVTKTSFLWFGKTSSFRFSTHHQHKPLTVVIRQLASTLAKIQNKICIRQTLITNAVS